MFDDEGAIRTLITDYYRAFQGKDAEAITRLLQFPYTFWANGEMSASTNKEEFARWWTWYLNKVKTETGFVRGEILNLRIQWLSDTAALVRMRSSRLGANDRFISEVRTGFLTYKTSRGWKVSGLISSINE